MNDNCKYKIESKVRIRQQGDEYSVFNGKNARFFTTNEIGQFVLKKCDGDNTVNDIIDDLINSCVNVPSREIIQNDVEEIINRSIKFDILNEVK